MSLLDIDMDISYEQLIGEFVRCNLSKCYSVMIGTSALYLGGYGTQADFFIDFSRHSMCVLG